MAGRRRGEFLTRFREAVTWIEWNPEQFPKKHRHSHQVIARRTYFGIYFAIEPEVTTVVAVLDMRQDPPRNPRTLKTAIAADSIFFMNGDATESFGAWGWQRSNRRVSVFFKMIAPDL